MQTLYLVAISPHARCGNVEFAAALELPEIESQTSAAGALLHLNVSGGHCRRCFSRVNGGIFRWWIGGFERFDDERCTKKEFGSAIKLYRFVRGQVVLLEGWERLSYSFLLSRAASKLV